MKNILRSISFCLLLFSNPLLAQENKQLAKSGIATEMLFPEGKTKALILSFDDGMDADRRLVKLLNQYKVKGTFHLNSNRLGTAKYLQREEIKDLFKGHEVSVHSANHTGLTLLNKMDIVYEVVEDRRELERLTGYPVRGMAYPFGAYNDFVVEMVKGLGITYARIVGDSYNFSIPTDFLKWSPTIHQFGKTNYISNDTAFDKLQLDTFYQVIQNFLTTKELALLDVWGHSWENDLVPARWTEMERFLKKVSNNPAIHYTTQIDLADYINAYKNLQFSVEKNMVTNLSSMDIYIKVKNQAYKINAGSTTNLNLPE